MRALLSAVPAPISIRDAEGRLVFANRAYALAVEARDADDAIARGLELLDRNARDEALRARTEGRTFAKRLPAVVAGQRRMLDVVEVSGTRGAAGVGIDATEAETIRSASPASSQRTGARSTSWRPRLRSSAPTSGWCSTTPPIARCSTSTPLSSTNGRRIRRSSTGSEPSASSGTSRFPRLEGAVAGRLSRRRAQGTPLVSARRPHLARSHQPQPGAWRHLSVRRHHQAHRLESRSTR